MRYWLVKTEPSAYSIDDLERDKVAHWDGVRNYQARNNLQAMQVGDQALFYHSSCNPPGVVGICEVVREAYPDHTAWESGSPYFDKRSTPGKPLWFMPDMKFVEKFEQMVALAELRNTPGLQDMPLLNRSRLSVQPVERKQWDIICSLARQ